MSTEVVIRDGATSDHIVDALRADPQRIRFETANVEWREPVDAAMGSSRTLVFEGLGLERTNFQRQYAGDAPMLFNFGDTFALRWRGVNFQGHELGTGPSVAFAFLDRWSWQEVGFYGSGGRGFSLGENEALAKPPSFPVEGWGRVSQFTWWRVEAHRNAHGNIIRGARAFSIGGDSSFERNGAGPDLEVQGDTRIPGRCGHGSIRDARFERDGVVPSLVLRGLSGMHVGANRFVSGYMDAWCDASTWYADTLIGPQGHRRVGLGNKWAGRGYVLKGGGIFSTPRLELEPESSFDLRLPYDPSGA